MKWLQKLINDHPSIINEELAPLLNCSPDEIHWKSPLDDDELSEYRDQDAVDRLGARLAEHQLDEFWPANGPQWDALAVAAARKDKYIFAEAKSHICEVCSSGSTAGEESLKRIRASLSTTKRFLGSETRTNWSKSYYQYANRLAHLYLFRELNHLDAYLLFICFMNDTEMGGPQSIEEWRTVIQLTERSLGIHQHRLSKFAPAIFIDVNRLRDS
jgi:hypothetical protein